MAVFAFVGKKLEQLCSRLCLLILNFVKFVWFFILYFYHYVIHRMNHFTIEVFYFLLISCVGFIILNATDPKTDTFTPRKVDLFFTAISAATVSSMSVVEMEVFSNTQLVIMTILMFIGGEVFTSMIGLLVRGFSRRSINKDGRVNDSMSDLGIPPSFHEQLELGAIGNPEFEGSKSDILDFGYDQELEVDSDQLKYDSIKFFGLLVLGYLLLVQILGVVSVLVYLNVISSAKNVLKQKGLNTFTFSIFTIVSTFASCGFVPTNENMIVFSKNSGLLLLLIPQILLGNTLYPSALRFSIWTLEKLKKKPETSYLLNNNKAIKFHHFLSHLHSSFLVVTVFVFILVQFILFSSMEWNSNSLSGLNNYQKFIGVLFQTINTRHTGETIVDLSAIAAASMVLIVVMMYLPPYTSFLPYSKNVNGDKNNDQRRKKESRRVLLENIVFSQLSYLVIFIILVCITEREKIKKDPLNFNVLNIVVEVISAYGNVGFSTGYSCDRQLKQDGVCENKWYGFSGKWSDGGKVVLIVVMVFGRLKKFNMNGGKAWKLL
ncbi:cation transporter HKT1;3-like [Rutidosis leptorrhynchoides]|uniref:cation transporter HKT1;3-like n=1 Tax=Rutidosis leptorrhynchoides TaxID=125765 RepID=UPI003A98DCFE